MSKLSRPARPRPYYLLLLPLFFVLHGALGHTAPSAGDVFVTFAKYAGLALLLTLTCRVLLRDAQRAALFAASLLAAQLFFGAFKDWLEGLPGGGWIARYAVLLPLLLLAAVLLFRYLRRPAARVAAAGRIANLILLSLVLLDGGLLVVRAHKTPPVLRATGGVFHNCDTCARPDIYLIVADGYAGLSELNGYLRYDNRPFISALATRGFDVIPESSGNYNYTAFSMAAMLQMDYLPGIGDRYRLRDEQELCVPLVANNRFWHFLRDRGYTLRNYSIFSMDGIAPPHASRFYRTLGDAVAAHTLTGRLNRDLRYHLFTTFRIRSELKYYARYDIRDGNQKAFESTLAESGRTSGPPRFVYTHLEMPHEPFFYRKDGSENSPEILASRDTQRPDLYVEYLQWCNARLLELIDGIRQRSRKPPIIIFVSDHGYRATTDRIPPAEQLKTIGAVLLPAPKPGTWPAGTTNVNVLRLLLNAEFGQDLPRLPDSVFFLRE